MQEIQVMQIKFDFQFIIEIEELKKKNSGQLSWTIYLMELNNFRSHCNTKIKRVKDWFVFFSLFNLPFYY